MLQIYCKYTDSWLYIVRQLRGMTEGCLFPLWAFFFARNRVLYDMKAKSRQGPNVCRYSGTKCPPKSRQGGNIVERAA